MNKKTRQEIFRKIICTFIFLVFFSNYFLQIAVAQSRFSLGSRTKFDTAQEALDYFSDSSPKEKAEFVNSSSVVCTENGYLLFSSDGTSKFKFSCFVNNLENKNLQVTLNLNANQKDYEFLGYIASNESAISFDGYGSLKFSINPNSRVLFNVFLASKKELKIDVATNYGKIFVLNDLEEFTQFVNSLHELESFLFLKNAYEEIFETKAALSYSVSNIQTSDSAVEFIFSSLSSPEIAALLNDEILQRSFEFGTVSLSIENSSGQIIASINDEVVGRADIAASFVPQQIIESSNQTVSFDSILSGNITKSEIPELDFFNQSVPDVNFTIEPQVISGSLGELNSESNLKRVSGKFSWSDFINSFVGWWQSLFSIFSSQSKKFVVIYTPLDPNNPGYAENGLLVGPKYLPDVVKEFPSLKEALNFLATSWQNDLTRNNLPLVEGNAWQLSTEDGTSYIFDLNRFTERRTQGLRFYNKLFVDEILAWFKKYIPDEAANELVLIFHNHPSGDPDISLIDKRYLARINDLTERGIVFNIFANTNGDFGLYYVSQSELNDLNRLYNENVERTDLPDVGRRIEFSEAEKFMRGEDFSEVTADTKAVFTTRGSPIDYAFAYLTFGKSVLYIPVKVGDIIKGFYKTGKIASDGYPEYDSIEGVVEMKSDGRFFVSKVTNLFLGITLSKVEIPVNQIQLDLDKNRRIIITNAGGTQDLLIFRGYHAIPEEFNPSDSQFIKNIFEKGIDANPGEPLLYWATDPYVSIASYATEADSILLIAKIPMNKIDTDPKIVDLFVKRDFAALNQKLVNDNKIAYFDPNPSSIAQSELRMLPPLGNSAVVAVATRNNIQTADGTTGNIIDLSTGRLIPNIQGETEAEITTTSIEKQLANDPFIKILQERISELTDGRYVLQIRGSAGYLGIDTKMISDFEIGVFVPDDIHRRYFRFFDKVFDETLNTKLTSIGAKVIKIEKEGILDQLLGRDYLGVEFSDGSVLILDESISQFLTLKSATTLGFFFELPILGDPQTIEEYLNLLEENGWTLEKVKERTLQNYKRLVEESARLYSDMDFVLIEQGRNIITPAKAIKRLLVASLLRNEPLPVRDSLKSEYLKWQDRFETEFLNSYHENAKQGETYYEFTKRTKYKFSSETVNEFRELFDSLVEKYDLVKNPEIVNEVSNNVIQIGERFVLKSLTGPFVEGVKGGSGAETLTTATVPTAPSKGTEIESLFANAQETREEITLPIDSKFFDDLVYGNKQGFSRFWSKYVEQNFRILLWRLGLRRDAGYVTPRSGFISLDVWNSLVGTNYYWATRHPELEKYASIAIDRDTGLMYFVYVDLHKSWLSPVSASDYFERAFNYYANMYEVSSFHSHPFDSRAGMTEQEIISTFAKRAKEITIPSSSDIIHAISDQPYSKKTLVIGTSYSYLTALSFWELDTSLFSQDDKNLINKVSFEIRNFKTTGDPIKDLFERARQPSYAYLQSLIRENKLNGLRRFNFVSFPETKTDTFEQTVTYGSLTLTRNSLSLEQKSQSAISVFIGPKGINLINSIKLEDMPIPEGSEIKAISIFSNGKGNFQKGILETQSDPHEINHDLLIQAANIMKESGIDVPLIVFGANKKSLAIYYINLEKIKEENLPFDIINGKKIYATSSSILETFGILSEVSIGNLPGSTLVSIDHSQVYFKYGEPGKTLPWSYGIDYSVENEFRALQEMYALDPEHFPRPIRLIYENGKAVGYLLERIDGLNLIQYSRIYDGVSFEIESQLKEIVKRLHDNGIAHGDLSVGNILVTKDGKTVKLIDPFGFSKNFKNFQEAVKDDIRKLENSIEIARIVGEKDKLKVTIVPESEVAKTAFEGPEPDLTQPSINAYLPAMQKVRTNVPLSEFEAELLIKLVVWYGRKRFLDNGVGLSTECLALTCGFAQSDIYYGLVSTFGKSAEIFTHQAAVLFDSKNSILHNHAFIVVRIKDTGQVFLIDTSFRQFFEYNPAGYFNQNGYRFASWWGDFMRKLPNGNQIANKLIRNGYLLLDSETAAFYSQGFSGGAVTLDVEDYLKKSTNEPEQTLSDLDEIFKFFREESRKEIQKERKYVTLYRSIDAFDPFKLPISEIIDDIFKTKILKSSALQVLGTEEKMWDVLESLEYPGGRKMGYDRNDPFANLEHQTSAPTWVEARGTEFLVNPYIGLTSDIRFLPRREVVIELLVPVDEILILTPEERSRIYQTKDFESLRGKTFVYDGPAEEEYDSIRPALNLVPYKPKIYYAGKIYTLDQNGNWQSEAGTFEFPPISEETVAEGTEEAPPSETVQARTGTEAKAANLAENHKREKLLLQKNSVAPVPGSQYYNSVISETSGFLTLVEQMIDLSLSPAEKLVADVVRSDILFRLEKMSEFLGILLEDSLIKSNYLFASSASETSRNEQLTNLHKTDLWQMYETLVEMNPSLEDARLLESGVNTQLAPENLERLMPGDVVSGIDRTWTETAGAVASQLEDQYFRSPVAGYTKGLPTGISRPSGIVRISDEYRKWIELTNPGQNIFTFELGIFGTIEWVKLSNGKIARISIDALGKETTEIFESEARAALQMVEDSELSRQAKALDKIKIEVDTDGKTKVSGERDASRPEPKWDSKSFEQSIGERLAREIPEDISKTFRDEKINEIFKGNDITIEFKNGKLTSVESSKLEASALSKYEEFGLTVNDKIGYEFKDGKPTKLKIEKSDGTKIEISFNDEGKPVEIRTDEKGQITVMELDPKTGNINKIVSSNTILEVQQSGKIAILTDNFKGELTFEGDNYKLKGVLDGETIEVTGRFESFSKEGLSKIIVDFAARGQKAELILRNGMRIGIEPNGKVTVSHKGRTSEIDLSGFPRDQIGLMEREVTKILDDFKLEGDSKVAILSDYGPLNFEKISLDNLNSLVERAVKEGISMDILVKDTYDLIRVESDGSVKIYSKEGKLTAEFAKEQALDLLKRNDMFDLFGKDSFDITAFSDAFNVRTGTFTENGLKELLKSSIENKIPIDILLHGDGSILKVGSDGSLKIFSKNEILMKELSPKEAVPYLDKLGFIKDPKTGGVDASIFSVRTKATVGVVDLLFDVMILASFGFDIGRLTSGDLQLGFETPLQVQETLSFGVTAAFAVYSTYHIITSVLRGARLVGGVGSLANPGVIVVWVATEVVLGMVPYMTANSVINGHFYTGPTFEGRYVENLFIPGNPFDSSITGIDPFQQWILDLGYTFSGQSSLLQNNPLYHDLTVKRINELLKESGYASLDEAAKDGKADDIIYAAGKWAENQMLATRVDPQSVGPFVVSGERTGDLMARLKYETDPNVIDQTYDQIIQSYIRAGLIDPENADFEKNRMMLSDYLRVQNSEIPSLETQLGSLQENIKKGIFSYFDLQYAESLQNEINKRKAANRALSSAIGDGIAAITVGSNYAYFIYDESTNTWTSVSETPQILTFDPSLGHWVGTFKIKDNEGNEVEVTLLVDVEDSLIVLPGDTGTSLVVVGNIQLKDTDGDGKIDQRWVQEYGLGGDSTINIFDYVTGELLGTMDLNFHSGKREGLDEGYTTFNLYDKDNNLIMSGTVGDPDCILGCTLYNPLTGKPVATRTGDITTYFDDQGRTVLVTVKGAITQIGFEFNGVFVNVNVEFWGGIGGGVYVGTFTSTFTDPNTGKEKTTTVNVVINPQTKKIKEISYTDPFTGDKVNFNFETNLVTLSHTDGSKDIIEIEPFKNAAPDIIVHVGSRGSYTILIPTGGTDENGNPEYITVSVPAGQEPTISPDGTITFTGYSGETVEISDQGAYSYVSITYANGQFSYRRCGGGKCTYISAEQYFEERFGYDIEPR